MLKVIKITKPDKTIHVAPLGTKARLQAHNSRLPASQKWKIEEIDEEEAKKLPFIDKNYVTGTEAQIKVSELEKENETLKKKLAALQNGEAGQTALVDPTADGKKKGK